MVKKSLIITGITCISFLLTGQVSNDLAKKDSIDLRQLHPSQIVNLNPVIVIDIHFDDPEDRREFLRTRHRVLKVYPYAIEAIEKMREAEEELEQMERRRKQRRFIRNEQRGLKDEYADFLKDFTVEEGRILIKIIEREMEEPFYDLIRNYRSGLTARYWNTMAVLYGYSLREGYDPEEEKILEMILQTLERGHRAE